MKRIFLSVLLLAFVLAGINCAKSRAFNFARKRSEQQLLWDGGFESGQGWYRSAPPDYSQYAVIALTQEIRKSGHRSGYVFLRRHPAEGGKVLHGWAQNIASLPKGRKVQFGGWVRIEGQPEVQFGLDYQVIHPRNGRTYFSLQLPQPVADGKFYFMEREAFIPEDVSEMVFFVGISSLGEAWFDDVFLRILP